ncbi:MAG: hypothetical protein Q9188_004346, partial [Gyalolechia gomerana]
MASDLNPQQNANLDAQVRQYTDNECVAAAALLQLWQANQDVQKTEPFNHEYAASDQ